MFKRPPVAPEAAADAQVVLHGASKTKHRLNGTKLTKVVQDRRPAGITGALEFTLKGNGTIQNERPRLLPASSPRW